MNDLEPIIRKIYVIRGQRVMLDKDRAQLDAINDALTQLQGQKAA